MTMGALHEGHLSLVRDAKSACDFVAVTVFVNPSQFGPSDDLDRYPRDLASDMKKLEALEVDLIFAPGDDEMYPPGYSTYVLPPDVATLWEGTFRPGHFRGVTTIVLKLLHVIPADVAFFGHKDFQQYLVIKKMAIDLDLATEIRVCPTQRDKDGLALSSRNAYLSSQDRQGARHQSSAQVGGRAGQRRRAPCGDDTSTHATGIVLVGHSIALTTWRSSIPTPCNPSTSSNTACWR